MSHWPNTIADTVKTRHRPGRDCRTDRIQAQPGHHYSLRSRASAFYRGSFEPEKPKETRMDGAPSIADKQKKPSSAKGKPRLQPGRGIVKRSLRPSFATRQRPFTTVRISSSRRSPLGESRKTVSNTIPYPILTGFSNHNAEGALTVGDDTGDVKDVVSVGAHSGLTNSGGQRPTRTNDKSSSSQARFSNASQSSGSSVSMASSRCIVQ